MAETIHCPFCGAIGLPDVGTKKGKRAFDTHVKACRIRFRADAAKHAISMRWEPPSPNYAKSVATQALAVADALIAGIEATYEPVDEPATSREPAEHEGANCEG